ncbi:unnamed protein product, partial [Choristocarpus tenellus]
MADPVRLPLHDRSNKIEETTPVQSLIRGFMTQKFALDYNVGGEAVARGKDSCATSVPEHQHEVASGGATFAKDINTTTYSGNQHTSAHGGGAFVEDINKCSPEHHLKERKHEDITTLNETSHSRSLSLSHPTTLLTSVRSLSYSPVACKL